MVADLFASFDTETTGLLDDPDARVVEVGVVLFDGDEPVEVYESFVCPGVLTSEGLRVAWEVSGISEEMIRSGASPAIVWRDMGRFLRDFEVSVVGWNVPFDVAMLHRTVFGTDDVQSRLVVLADVMWEFGRVFRPVTGGDPQNVDHGGVRRSTLNCARYVCGATFEGCAHSAAADALLCGRIYRGLVTGGMRPRQPRVQEVRGTVWGRGR